MRLLALLSLLFGTLASAAPVITAVQPGVGFTYASTRVSIHGSDLASATTACPVPPPGGTGPGTCPVEVFFGDTKGHVVFASPARIEVLTNPLIGGQPRPAGAVDVLVRSEGKGETLLAGGFRFDLVPPPDPTLYTAVLIPLTTAREVIGANGSVWRSELRVFNRSGIPLVPAGPVCNPDFPDSCLEPMVPPERTESILLYPGPVEGSDGAFLWLPKPLLDSALMSLRVRDISENAQSWGTAIPVVRSQDFATNLTIIDIPTDARYRGTLRIYSAGPSPQTVAYRIYRENDPVPVIDQRVELRGIVHPAPVFISEHPAYAQIDLLTPEVRAAGERIRVELDNLGANVSPPPPSIWGFVSVTNNESQQVTVMVP